MPRSAAPIAPTSPAAGAPPPTHEPSGPMTCAWCLSEPCTYCTIKLSSSGLAKVQHVLTSWSEPVIQK